jgi:hypothetical protein
MYPDSDLLDSHEHLTQSLKKAQIAMSLLRAKHPVIALPLPCHYPRKIFHIHLGTHIVDLQYIVPRQETIFFLSIFFLRGVVPPTIHRRLSYARSST